MRIFLEYYALKGVLLLTKLLPIPLIYGFCKLLAALFFTLDKRRRTITLQNLALAYPHKTEDERYTLAKNIYKSVAISIAEMLLMMHQRLDIDLMVSNYEEALHELKRYFDDANRGKLLLTAHFGNWELLAHFLAKHGYPMVVIGRKGNNHLIEEHITTPFRTRYGNTLAHKSKAMAAIVRAFTQKKIAGMLIDQKSGGSSSIKINFFGHPADTINSIGLLKLRYNPSVVPLFMAHQSDGRYKLIIGSTQEIALPEELNETEKIKRLTQHYNDIIEAVIKEYPEQWFWMHDRWRLFK